MSDVETKAEKQKHQEAIESHPTEIGVRPSFHALWHLRELGVVEDLNTFASQVWERKNADKPVRVAVIDTPVAYKHPNLVGVVDLGLMRDFSVFDDGVFVADPSELSEADLERRREVVDKSVRSATCLNKAIQKEASDESYRRQFAPTTFGTHGTAVSGLIGGRPTTITYCEPAYFGEESVPLKKQGFDLPFSGINPLCSIVPISMTAAPYASMVMGALEYALLIEAKVVVVAAAWAEDVDRERDPDGWNKVDAILKKLCEVSVVLCAAGNQATRQLVYPASQSKRDSGPWAVTACAIDGVALNYAPKVDKNRRMLKTLSSEVARYDRNMELVDPWAKADPDLALPKGDPSEYPVRDIISLDVPGPQGYNPSPYSHTPNGKYGESDEHYEIGSLFCRFSGTSAATAIAAGLISLAIQEEIGGSAQQRGNAVAVQSDATQAITPNPSGSLLNVTVAKSLFSEEHR